MARERLQKVLAHAGVASRRAAEALIAAGRVRVNGRIVNKLGTLADAHHDRVEVDGRRIVLEKPVYFVLHKPRGTVTTMNDPEGRPSIVELLKGIPERVYPVGRLDYETSGVLLVTNDGELAEALLRPKRGVPKTYVTKVRGHINEEHLDQLRNGVKLDDGTKTRKADVFVIREDGNNTWMQVTLTEGKNRQIHRMLEAIGRRVQRLARISFADITAEGLRPGEWRPLAAKEIDKLRKTFMRGDTPPAQRTPSRSGASKTSPRPRSDARDPARKRPSKRPGKKGYAAPQKKTSAPQRATKKTKSSHR